MSNYVVDIVFVQDWENEQYEQSIEGNSIPDWGDWEAIGEYLTQWDFGDETDSAHTHNLPEGEYYWGTSDDTMEFRYGGLYYTLSWNSKLRYVGLTRRPLSNAIHPFYWESE